jgi:hypothetical protein
MDSSSSIARMRSRLCPPPLSGSERRVEHTWIGASC